MQSVLQRAVWRLRDFGRDEEGLVTVEWVALASAAVIGGIPIAASLFLFSRQLKRPCNGAAVVSGARGNGLPPHGLGLPTFGIALFRWLYACDSAKQP